MKLKLDWPRCPDGVSASPTSKDWQADPESAGRTTGGILRGGGVLGRSGMIEVEIPIPSFANNSEKVDVASYEMSTLDTTFVVPFVNATTTEKRRKFLDDYG